MNTLTSASVVTPKVLGVYLSLLVDVVANWNISAEGLLEGSGVVPEQLNDPLWSVDFRTYTQIFKRALTLTNEPGLGFYVGMQMKVSCHGLIGFAAMVAKDIREALDIALQFSRLQSSVLSFDLKIEGEFVSFYIGETSPDYSFGEAGIISMMLGTALMAEALTGKRPEGISDFTFKRPDYFARFEHLLPGISRFEQPFTRAIFPVEYLDLPLMMSDPLTARLAREQCKRELNALMQNPSFSRLVSELVYDEVLGFCTMEEVAEKLYVSTRTLQRQLAQENKKFSTLIDELRQRKAVALVKKRELTPEQIAVRLGYSDTANFIRAFKRWTGKTPSKY